MQMQQAARELNEQRRIKTDYKEDASGVVDKKGGYLREVRSDAFMNSEMKLDERLNRQSHYRSRNLDRE